MPAKRPDTHRTGPSTSPAAPAIRRPTDALQAARSKAIAARDELDQLRARRAKRRPMDSPEALEDRLAIEPTRKAFEVAARELLEVVSR